MTQLLRSAMRTIGMVIDDGGQRDGPVLQRGFKGNHIQPIKTIHWPHCLQMQCYREIMAMPLMAQRRIAVLTGKSGADPIIIECRGRINACMRRWSSRSGWQSWMIGGHKIKSHASIARIIARETAAA